MTKTNGNTLAYRVGELEKSYDKLDLKLSMLLENHLPHLDSKIDSLNVTIKVLSALNIIGIILGAIFLSLLK